MERAPWCVGLPANAHDTSLRTLETSQLLLKMRPRGVVYRGSPNHTCLGIGRICINVPLHDLSMTHPSRLPKRCSACQVEEAEARTASRLALCERSQQD